MFKKTSFLVILFLVAVSCAKEYSVNVGLGEELRFEVSDCSDDTRSVTATTVSTLEADGFRVAGLVGTEEYFNTTVTKSGSVFTPSTAIYAPADGEFSVFAVYPSSQAISLSEGSTSLSYTSDESTDLVAASALGQTKDNLPVHLSFGHVLSLVKVQCKGKDNKVDYAVKSVSFTLPESGIYSYSDAGWSSLGEDKACLFYSGDTSVSTEEYTDIEGSLTGIPGKTTITVSWDCLDKTSGSVIASYSKSSSVTLTQGNRSTVRCSLPNDGSEPISFQVSVSSWEDEEDLVTLGTLSVNVDSKEMMAEGGSFSVIATSELDSPITARTSASWLTVEKTKASEAFTISVEANTSSASRTGRVVFFDRDSVNGVEIRQEGAPVVFSLDKTQISVSESEYTVVNVTSSESYELRNDADWIEYIKDGDQYSFKATGSAASNRETILHFINESETDLTLKVSQQRTTLKVSEYPGCNLRRDYQQQTFPATVVTTVASYTVSYEGDWISEVSHSDDSWLFTLSENTGPVLREGAVVFHYDEREFRLFVVQYPAQTENYYLDCVYSVDTISEPVTILGDASHFVSMYVDGASVSETPLTTYSFDTIGEHTIRFIPKSDTNDFSYSFRNCKNLKSVDGTHFTMPFETSSWMFDGCNSLENIAGLGSWDIHKMMKTNPGYYILSSGGGTNAMFQYCFAYEHLVLPQIENIDNFMINHLNSIDNTSITIPACVKKIGGAHTFYNTGKRGVFTEFIVESGNTAFKTVDGCLYSMDGTEFVACPMSPVVSNHTLEIPEGVTKFGELCFNREDTFTKLLLPDSYVITEYTNGSPGGRGAGLNYGNSLSIALFCYTAVNEYSVKSTNPNYIADGGCIYSKDGAHLIAVPYNYEGGLTVREGCTHINREAFWCGGYDALPLTTTLHIPASVTSIHSSQVEIINRAVTEHGLNVTVDANNAVYAIQDGKIISK